MRGVLVSLRSLAGQNYSGLLAQAGLDRFAHELPSDSDEPAASSLELARLTALVYSSLPRNLAFVFFRKVGGYTASQYLSQPFYQTLAEEVAVLPEAQRLLFAVRHVAQSRVITTNRISHVQQVEGEVQLTLNPCPYCLLIEPSEVPVCHMVTEFFRVLLRGLIGRGFTISEVECVRMGAEGCCFSFSG